MTSTTRNGVISALDQAEQSYKAAHQRLMGAEAGTPALWRDLADTEETLAAAFRTAHTMLGGSDPLYRALIYAVVGVQGQADDHRRVAARLERAGATRQAPPTPAPNPKPDTRQVQEDRP